MAWTAIRGPAPTDAPRTSCADPGGTDLEARRTALRDGCRCAAEQHYDYRWDELNRLAEARRDDRGSGVYRLAVRQRYDSANGRTVKQTLAEPGPDPAERIALYVYPGDFERRGLGRDLATDTYEADTALGHRLTS